MTAVVATDSTCGRAPQDHSSFCAGPDSNSPAPEINSDGALSIGTVLHKCRHVYGNCKNHEPAGLSVKDFRLLGKTGAESSVRQQWFA